MLYDGISHPLKSEIASKEPPEGGSLRFSFKNTYRSAHTDCSYEQPVVDPHVSHFMQVPFRTSVKLLHSVHMSPS